MATTALVGAQWGDEGKGKIIDILSAEADMVVRSQGGDNAGHTVVADNEVFMLHLVPSGILYKNTVCVIAAGTVINPKSLIGEMESLKNRKSDDIGTTKKGIGPCYMDKAERIGLRICDLVGENFEGKLRPVLAAKNEILQKIYGAAPLSFDDVYAEYKAYAEKLRPYVCDASALVYDAIKANKKVLFEGAQGTLLDLDSGTYPYVTSSHPTSGGFCIGTGIGPTLIDNCVGISKAYTTRVGKGPFPTELNDEIGTFLRETGLEFGTTTGRPRRCGWLDLVILRYSIRVNGLTRLAVNKLDTLSGLETLKICVDYEYNGGILHDFPGDIEKLAKCKPIYKEFKGWKEDISKVRRFDDLPSAAKDYILFIEKSLDCPVAMVGVGGGRNQNLNRN